jgi:hypothetical protein
MSSPAPARTPTTAEAVPSRFGAVWFAVKASLLRGRRGIQNFLSHVPLHAANVGVELYVQIAEVRSPLWTTESMVERALQLGKVQNLRIAGHALDGVVVPGKQLFSFWRQLGRASRGKGYVSGRELREGCLIPAIGGGLCQLSNALYDAALQCGCEIVERHAHSRVVPGSAAAFGRDATVAWNYVDLRFRPQQDIRIRVELSAQELTVRFLAAQPVSFNSALTNVPGTLPRVLNPIAHTCTDCGASECFRHVEPHAQTSGKTAYLLDECWPEFLAYAEEHATHDDFAAAPALYGRYRSVRRLASKTNLHTTLRPAFWRAIRMRCAPSVPARVQAQLAGSRHIAEAMVADLPFDATHIVVAQSLLPFLWRTGALGGRTFDVVMTRMPLAQLHRLLDEASAQHPEFSTLREYRAPQNMIDAEQEALTAARHIITPHGAIADLFEERAIRLLWAMPNVKSKRCGHMIVFPGPTVARKGALALRSALVASDCDLMILGGNLERADFWQGVRVVSPTENWIDYAAVVVQPALLEDNPRPLLRAVAAGIPVICTTNCGLGDLPGFTTVKFGNAEQLRAAISSALQNSDAACECSSESR